MFGLLPKLMARVRFRHPLLPTKPEQERGSEALAPLIISVPGLRVMVNAWTMQGSAVRRGGKRCGAGLPPSRTEKLSHV
jgi:hypothetical protein